jgi:1-acyl-sn-glycerol-3-phosphate acyltransferase
MDPPSRPIRRLVLTPLAWAGSLVAIAISPVLLVISAACDLVDRKRWRFTRLLALGVAFCVLEFAALSAALAIRVATAWRRYPAAEVAANQAVLSWWLGSITSMLRRCLNFTFDVRFPVTGDQPLVVLSRHAGPGDALFLMSELANTQRREIRALGKSKLLWDPFFDHVATRAGFVFLPPGETATADLIRANSAMPPRGAFITFPEGGNFTPSRRREAVAGLRRAGQVDRADTAESLRHLLLPRAGGVHAALEGSPTALVVFVGHSGYDDIGSLTQLWRAIPDGRHIRLEARIVPRPDGWMDRQVVADWLLSCWSDMDRWIRKHSAGRS